MCTLPYPNFNSKRASLAHSETGWLLHIQQRLCDLNAHIEIEDAWTPLPQCLNDQSLMEVFCRMRQQKGTSDSKLHQVNRVRIWLRVITIAELANPDGACISPEKFTGNWRNDSTLTWPN